MKVNRRTVMTAALGVFVAPALTGPAMAHDQQHKVSIQDFGFDPADLVVQPGDHIIFTKP